MYRLGPLLEIRRAPAARESGDEADRGFVLELVLCLSLCFDLGFGPGSGLCFVPHLAPPGTELWEEAHPADS